MGVVPLGGLELELEMEWSSLGKGVANWCADFFDAARWRVGGDPVRGLCLSAA
jgi:hypothetical protein